MKVRLLVPRGPDMGVSELLGRVLAAPRRAPFAEEIVEFCAALSGALLTDPEAGRFPELQALGFWLRRAAVTHLKRDFLALEGMDTVLVPRGLVFHLPPSNVDSLFLYCWALAALAGNRNIIRLSTKDSPQARVILRLFNEFIDGEALGTAIISYGHEHEITAALSASADVRVIWGGDATVSSIRSIPLPPHAKDLTFADRYSMSAIKARSFWSLPEGGRRELAGRFYNDMFWFDQMACSSPRLLVWCGGRDECRKASGLFFDDLLKEIGHRGYALDTGAILNKLTFSYGAILDQPVARYEFLGTELTVLTLESLEALKREHCGGGLLFQVCVGGLAALAPVVEHRDQTLTHFGFGEDELRDFVRSLNGRGLDRVVPIGRALDFHRFWDGYDLLQEMMRRIHVDVSSETWRRSLARKVVAV